MSHGFIGRPISVWTTNSGLRSLPVQVRTNLIKSTCCAPKMLNQQLGEKRPYLFNGMSTSDELTRKKFKILNTLLFDKYSIISIWLTYQYIVQDIRVTSNLRATNYVTTGRTGLYHTSAAGPIAENPPPWLEPFLILFRENPPLSAKQENFKITW